MRAPRNAVFDLRSKFPKRSTVIISRKEGDQHRYHQAKRDSYSGVKAYWYDTNEAKKQSVIAGISGNTKRLRTTYTTENDARFAVVSEWQRLQRGLATFEITLARGNASLMPTLPIKLTGFKPEIDSIDWRTTRVTHHLNKQGFTTRLEIEIKTEAAEVAIEVENE